MTAEDLIAPIEAGDVAAVAAALSADPSLIHARTRDDDTLLHLACWQKKDAIVAVLMGYGPDLDARGCYGRTPLHYAVHEGDRRSVGLVRVLMQAGADPTLREDNGFSVEDWARIEIYEDLEPVVALLRSRRP